MSDEAPGEKKLSVRERARLMNDAASVNSGISVDEHLAELKDNARRQKEERLEEKSRKKTTAAAEATPSEATILVEDEHNEPSKDIAPDVEKDKELPAEESNLIVYIGVGVGIVTIGAVAFLLGGPLGLFGAKAAAGATGKGYAVAVGTGASGAAAGTKAIY